MITDRLLTLRRAVNGLSQGHSSTVFDPISLGARTVDEALGGGLVRGGLHEVYAATTAHTGAATGFAVALAFKASRERPILWVRQDYLDTEIGRLNASGLAELGFNPSRVILVRAKDAEGVLRAGEQAARCPALGTVLIEPWGTPKILDLTASRRLSLASAKSGVPTVMLRVAASPSQSAAATRWMVEALPSHPLAANAPGFPVFQLTLLRQRGGVAGRSWPLEWDRDRKCFQERQQPASAPVSRAVVSVSPDRPATAGARIQEFRRTG